MMLTKELARRIGSLDAVVGLLAELYLLYYGHRRTSHSAENLRLAKAAPHCQRGASGVGMPEFNRNPLLGVELFEDS